MATVSVSPTSNVIVTLDRGVAGNGIVSISSTTISSQYYLVITYTNGTTENVGPFATGIATVSVASANGLAGTSSGGSTPALTLSTTVTGLVKGNGTALSAAVAGTDYVAIGGVLGTPSSGTVTNLTGTASININGTVNGTVGATTPSSGVFTSVGMTTGTVSTSPSGNTDIANKAYVDTVAQGLDTKASCVAATTANITLSGAPQTIDGVSLAVGDRCLVKNQTAAQDNGIYLVATGSWTRTSDMDVWSEVPGAYTFIETGSVQADTGWVCTSNAGGTIGSTAMVWAQFSGAGSGVSSITFGSTGLTPTTATGGAVSVGGTLAVANGGTGVGSSTGSISVVLSTSPTITTPVITGYTETVTVSGTIGATATLAITAGTVLTATLTSATACTITLPSVSTAGKSFILLLKQPASGTATTATFVTSPASYIKWSSAGAPTITATVGKMDILTFVSDGTNWYGSYVQGYTP